MIKKLQQLKKNKKYFVLDFDRTITKIEIDWSEWHQGVAKIYAEFDPNHGYQKGKNPHTYHNNLVNKHGKELLEKIKKFNQEYETEHTTGFTPNDELVEFIKNNPQLTFYVYSSNSRPTVINGLTKLGILDKFTQIVSKNEVSLVKPNPEGFSLFTDFDTKRDLFVMVGDSSADQQAAENAGVEFVECNQFRKYVHEE